MCVQGICSLKMPQLYTRQPLRMCHQKEVRHCRKGRLLSHTADKYSCPQCLPSRFLDAISLLSDHLFSHNLVQVEIPSHHYLLLPTSGIWHLRNATRLAVCFSILKRPLIAYPTRQTLHSQSTPTSIPLAHKLSEDAASTSCFEWCRVIMAPI